MIKYAPLKFSLALLYLCAVSGSAQKLDLINSTVFFLIPVIPFIPISIVNLLKKKNLNNARIT